jgi:transcriptional/translational regulatory protein YebC/TACO1
MSPQMDCRYHSCLFSLAVPKLGCLMGGSVPEACDTLRYEGYGPGGTAVLVDGAAAAQDLALQLRQLFRASGGYLGARGSVSYLFNHVGVLRFPATQAGSRLMNRALQAGAEDVVAQSDGSMEVLVDPPDFARIRRQLADGGYGATIAQITWRPALRVSLQGQDAQQMAQLLLSLRKLTGVQNVYSNAEISEPLLAGI